MSRKHVFEKIAEVQRSFVQLCGHARTGRTIHCFRSSMSELSSGRAAAAFSPQGLVKWKRVSPIPEGYCITSSVYIRSTVLLKINNSPEISRMTGSNCSVGSNVTVVCAINLHLWSTTIRFVLSIWTSTQILSVTLKVDYVHSRSFAR